MRVEFKSSFTKDVKKIKDKDLKERIWQIIEFIEQAKYPREIKDLERLRGEGRYYRVKVGDYRIGLIVDGGTVIFVRFLHRKDIYRYFP